MTLPKSVEPGETASCPCAMPVPASPIISVELTAVEFTEVRNNELKVPTYKIYTLTEMTADDLISAAEQQQESRYGGDGHFADNH